MTTLDELRKMRVCLPFALDANIEMESVRSFVKVFDLAEAMLMLQEMGPDLVSVFSAVGSEGVTWQCGMAFAAHGSPAAAIREAHATWKETSEP